MDQVADSHGAIRIFDKESGLREDSKKIIELRKPKVILQRITPHVPEPADHRVTVSTSGVAPIGENVENLYPYV